MNGYLERHPEVRVTTIPPLPGLRSPQSTREPPKRDRSREALKRAYSKQPHDVTREMIWVVAKSVMGKAPLMRDVFVEETALWFGDDVAEWLASRIYVATATP